jgi:hypothetical protein
MNARRIHNRVCCGLMVLVLCGLPARAAIPLGIRACWEFEEGSGAIAHDTSGNGFDGAFYSSPAWVPGIQGEALEFLGHDMVWQIPSSFDDTVTDGFTIAGWIFWYGSTPGAVQYALFDAAGGAWSRGFYLYLREDGHVRFSVLRNSGMSQGIDSATTLTPNEWSHVAATFDFASGGGAIHVFVNGEEDPASPVPASEAYHNDWDSPAIGNNHWAPGDGSWKPLNGCIDNVYFYDRVLGPEEVSELYRASGPRPVGDLNCDGAVNFGDINPFTLALTNWGAYVQQYPECDIDLADINGDGYVDFGDINPFVALFMGE